MDMDINTKTEGIRLSISDLENYKKILTMKKKQLTEIAKNIATKIAEEASKDTYKSVEVVPARLYAGRATAYVRSTDEIDTYREFGTGIVGSRNPHVSDALDRAGWIYDVNEHGDAGWIYPKKDGGFGWTKGQPAQRKFYLAMERAREKAPEIAKEEFKKLKNT
jgi:hypothetical protein